MKTQISRQKIAFVLSLSFFMFFLSVPATQGAEFSSLLRRGTDFNSMAFNSQGDLYFIGWEAGLERTVASQLPDGKSELLIPMNNYLSVFEPSAIEVIDINSAGIGFDRLGRVISYIEGVYSVMEGSQPTEKARVKFVRYDPSSKTNDALVLTAGENIPELGLIAGSNFDVDSRVNQPLQMVVTLVDGAETILFTLYEVPVIFQMPVSGGQVKSFYRFEEEGHPGSLTVMNRVGSRSVIASHSNGNIYRFNPDRNPTTQTHDRSQLLEKADLLTFFGEPNLYWGIVFRDLDYDPVSDRLYVACFIDGYSPEVLTLIAITPDTKSLAKVFDVNDLTSALKDIRTPQYGPALWFNSVAMNPVSIFQGQARLFLGDYWSGLEMVRVNLSNNPPLTPASQMGNIVNFYSKAVSSGNVTGISNNPIVNRISVNLFGAGLQTTYRYLQNGVPSTPSALSRFCQLTIGSYLRLTDSKPSPTDPISGNGVGELHDRIAALGVSLGCN